ncbi:class I SAM-dependent methyltransferase [Micromonospora rubida]|uniref:Class I SAM-dependent methyltransferase n=1 Tax=Micromonospora rubida TaxID=2697657 RepID=A0ABW7SPQ0_9ACTN
MPEHRPAEPDILRYYTDVFAEADRLHRTPQGRLEFARTKELLARVLPDAPATVLDIGGGPGVYAGWLAAAGYRVHLLDLVPSHATAARVTRPGGPVAAAAISRSAPVVDLTRQGRIDARTRPAVLAVYASGVNDPETGFTTAYFHQPEQLVAEFTAAGLPAPRLYGIEGPLWPLLDALGVQPTERLFTDALDCARVVESDPSVLGSSGHLLAVAVA